MTTVDVRLGISLEVDNHVWQNCTDLAEPLRQQMSSGKYDEMSVLPIPLEIEEWRSDNRTARKRANRAAARGYRVHDLPMERWLDDIYAINTSTPRRQGRPMADSYREFPSHSKLDTYPCARHAVRSSGVWSPASKLVGYIVVIRAGELALVSQILGHEEYKKDEIMSLLFEYALKREIAADPEGLMVYNRHDSGTWGLRQWKEWHGFQAMPVEWLP